MGNSHLKQLYITAEIISSSIRQNLWRILDEPAVGGRGDAEICNRKDHFTPEICGNLWRILGVEMNASACHNWYLTAFIPNCSDFNGNEVESQEKNQITLISSNRPSPLDPIPRKSLSSHISDSLAGM
jgi:hypothetical protein